MPVIVLGLKEDLAKLAKERQGRRTDLEDADNIPANLPGSSGETRDVLAEMAGVSHGTLDKVDLSARVSFREFRNDNRHGVGYFPNGGGRAKAGHSGTGAG